MEDHFAVKDVCAFQKAPHDALYLREGEKTSLKEMSLEEMLQ